MYRRSLNLLWMRKTTNNGMTNRIKYIKENIMIKDKDGVSPSDKCSTTIYLFYGIKMRKITHLNITHLNIEYGTKFYGAFYYKGT